RNVISTPPPSPEPTGPTGLASITTASGATPSGYPKLATTLAWRRCRIRACVLPIEGGGHENRGAKAIRRSSAAHRGARRGGKQPLVREIARRGLAPGPRSPRLV